MSVETKRRELGFLIYQDNRFRGCGQKLDSPMLQKELNLVEVKSYKNRSSSLRQLIRSEKYDDVKFVIKLGDLNTRYENRPYTKQNAAICRASRLLTKSKGKFLFDFS